MQDNVVGDLTYTDFWERADTLQLFGREYAVTLVFPGEPDEELQDCQRRAYGAFWANRTACLRKAEDALLAYYRNVGPEVRHRLQDSADGLAPLLSTSEELARVLTPTEVSFPDVAKGERVVGLLFDCTWDPELGVGVKLVNEEVAEVGTQDIVL